MLYKDVLKMTWKEFVDYKLKDIDDETLIAMLCATASGIIYLTKNKHNAICSNTAGCRLEHYGEWQLVSNQYRFNIKDYKRTWCVDNDDADYLEPIEEKEESAWKSVRRSDFNELYRKVEQLEKEKGDLQTELIGIYEKEGRFDFVRAKREYEEKLKELENGQ